MNRPLSERVALITGASSGIGRATALRLAQSGACVVAAARKESGLRELTAELDDVSGPGRHFGASVDIRSGDGLQPLIEEARRRFGFVDALIVSAGIFGTPDNRSLPYSTADTPVELWDDVLSTNLRGAFLSVKTILPSMMDNGYGDIILVSSARAGRYGCLFAAPYSASKFALYGFASCIAEELAPRDIRVQVVSPDLTSTPMLGNPGGQKMPGNAMHPDRVANLIAHLLTAPRDTVYGGAVIGAFGNAPELASRWRSPLTRTLV